MKGFTLLEVLISMVFFSIAVFGIYSLLNQTLSFASWTENRLDLILSSSELVVLAEEDPPSSTLGWVPLDNNIEYKITKQKLSIFSINKMDIFFKKGSVKINYVLYY